MIKRIFLKLKKILNAIFNFFEKDSPNINWVEKNASLKSYSEEIPKNIWMYWDSAEKNHLVDFCIYNAKQLCPDYKVIVLNKHNVHEYLDLPIFKDGLQTAIIADYIRLSLLKKYGGIWMDASILLTQDFNWFLSKMKYFENFVCYSDDCTTDYNKPITENWFIAARLNSDFIKDWLAEFEKCCLSEDPNTYYKNYKGNSIIQNIPNTDYLMCYISAAIILTKEKYSILYANSGSTGHYYNYRLNWLGFLIAIKIFFCSNIKVYHPKMVKFTSSTRYYPNLFVEKRLVFSRSMFGKSFELYLKKIGIK